MKTLLGLVFGLALVCFCAETFAQCRQSGGGGGTGGGGGQTGGGGGQGFASFQRGDQGGGSQARLLTGPGSYFHDLMVQNYRQQQMARQQAMVAAAKQAQKNVRRGRQLDTRRAQREAELARREERKRAAALKENISRSNQVRLATR